MNMMISLKSICIFGACIFLVNILASCGSGGRDKPNKYNSSTAGDILCTNGIDQYGNTCGGTSSSSNGSGTSPSSNSSQNSGSSSSSIPGYNTVVNYNGTTVDTCYQSLNSIQCTNAPSPGSKEASDCTCYSAALNLCLANASDNTVASNSLNSFNTAMSIASAGGISCTINGNHYGSSTSGGSGSSSGSSSNGSNGSPSSSGSGNGSGSSISGGEPVDATSCLLVESAKRGNICGAGANTSLWLTVKNTCSNLITANECLEKIDGSLDCGTNVLGPGSSGSYWTCNSTGWYYINACLGDLFDSHCPTPTKSATLKSELLSPIDSFASFTHEVFVKVYETSTDNQILNY